MELLPVAELRVRNDESVRATLVTTGDVGPVSFEVTVFPAHGDVTFEGNDLVYVPDPGSLGPDAASVRAVDSRGPSAPVPVDMRIFPDNWLDVGLEQRAQVRVLQFATAGPVADMPVLVEIDGANAGFADFASAAAEIVVFATPDGVVLPSELNDVAGSRRRYWVLADIDTRSGFDVFHVYAGGSTSLTLPAPRDVWDDYEAVYHFEGPNPLRDATEAHADLDVVGVAPAFADCRVGRCVVISGSGHYSIGTGLPELNEAVGCTLSATMAPRVANSFGTAVAWQAGSTAQPRVELGLEASKPTSRANTNDAATRGATSATTVLGDVEVRSDLTVVPAAARMTLFDDGGQAAFDAGLVAAATFPNSDSGTATIGANVTGAQLFEGKIDEVRLTRLVRSTDFIFVDARSRAGELTTLQAVEAP